MTARSTVFGDIGDGLISLDAQDAGPFRVDGVDGAAKGTGHQVPQHRSSDAVDVLSSAHDGDGLGEEKDIQGLVALAVQLFTRWFGYLHVRYPSWVRTRRG